MSYEYQTRKNKEQKHPKIQFEQYLFNSAEENYDATSDIQPEPDAEIMINSFKERRRFRQIAQRLRSRYS